MTQIDKNIVEWKNSYLAASSSKSPLIVFFPIDKNTLNEFIDHNLNLSSVISLKSFIIWLYFSRCYAYDLSRIYAMAAVSNILDLFYSYIRAFALFSVGFSELFRRIILAVNIRKPVLVHREFVLQPICMPTTSQFAQFALC